MAAKTPALRDRIKTIAAQSAPSMVPAPRETQQAEDIPAPPQKEEEVVPSIADIIPDLKERLLLARLVATYGEMGITKHSLDKQQKALSTQAKKIVGKYGIARAVSGEWRISYYNAARETLSKELLLAAGVPLATILACTKTTPAYTLRISKIKDEAEEGEE